MEHEELIQECFRHMKAIEDCRDYITPNELSLMEDTQAEIERQIEENIILHNIKNINPINDN